jgi:hypothetical protein
MDDLLAQIFGHLRDERAALQASMPDMKAMRPRTPPSGIEAQPNIETGPVPLDASSPVPKEELDPPVRPIHAPDELTPPAVDVDDLRAQEKS